MCTSVSAVKRLGSVLREFQNQFVEGVMRICVQPPLTVYFVGHVFGSLVSRWGYKGGGFVTDYYTYEGNVSGGRSAATCKLAC